MSSHRSFPKMLILSVAAMFVLGTLAVLIVSQANRSREEIPVWGQLHDFSFTNAVDEQPFGYQQMLGKINVVDFIFTNCPGACPIMAVNMEDLYESYKGTDKVQFVSVSVDPGRDSVEALRQYAEDRGVTDSRWIFLRAPIDDVKALCEGQFMLAADELPMGHTTKFILVDQQGQIRGYYEGLESDSMIGLKNAIRQLANE